MMTKHIRRAKTLTKLLENQFRIGKFSFGLDPILGLFPGTGDFISSILSLYIIWIAFVHKLPGGKLLQMLWNILIDYVVGIIPFLGDILDFAIKSNTKNLKILEEHIKKDGGVLEGEIVN